MCQGQEAAVAFIGAPSQEVDEVLAEYPVLALPEFPAAIEALGRAQRDPEAARACLAGAERESTDRYASLLTQCAVLLAREVQGDPRVNLLRAVRLYHDARAALSSAGHA